MQTQVAIIGAGPAGLLLGHLLQQAGIDTVILENRNETFLRANWRGGMIEPAIAQILIDNGVGEQLQKEGIKVEGIQFHYNGEKQRIVFGDKHPIIYNQHDLIEDLIDIRRTLQQSTIFEGKGQRYEGLDTPNPRIHYTLNAALYQLDCEFVIGCDGFRGISRRVIPASTRKEIQEELPYAWLDWLVDAPPRVKAPIYGYHADGFALQMPTSDGKTRLHLQIKRGTEKEDLPSEGELWQQFEIRLNTKLNRGKVIQQKLDYMRHFHTQNWQNGRLFIAGDAAHVVERTGSKGLNMAFADAIYLASALIDFYKKGDRTSLDNYTNLALTRTLEVKKFTAWFTKLMHVNLAASSVEKVAQFQEISNLFKDKAAVENLVQNLIGLPL
ncbi:MAG: 4-hydroxybenzoate 3-monooxygenase [Saprospiraceae bacterium]